MCMFEQEIVKGGNFPSQEQISNRQKKKVLFDSDSSSSVIVALSIMRFKINVIQIVKILVHQAVLVESVEHADPAFSGEFLGQNQDDTK